MIICGIAVGPALLFYSSIPRSVRVLGLPLWFFLVGVVYYALFESSHLQASPGKLALGLRVTTLGGERISIMRGFGRAFSRLIGGSLTLHIGYLIILFTQKKQRLHDLIAGTLVVKKSD